MSALQPSVSFDEAARESWDAVVIGAGCAGSIAARELARGGARVVLVDKAKFPRYKVCGCCISAPAQATLEQVGLGGLVESLGAVPAHVFQVGADAQRVSIPLPRYLILSRERLDAALIEAAQSSGALFLQGVTASLDSVDDDMRTVRLSTDDASVCVTTKVVLIADGLGSRLLRATDPFDSVPARHSRIGAGTVCEIAPEWYRSGIIYMTCGAGGYVGASRLEDGRLVVAATYDTRFVKSTGGLAEAASRILSEAGFPEIDGLGDAPWKGTPLLTQRPTAVAAHRAFVIGDAAGYVEPFTGEGMKWAMASGVEVAPIALRAIERYSPLHEAEWARTHRCHVTRRTAMCRVIAGSLRRPRLVKTALQVLALAPAVAAPFVRYLNDAGG